MMPKIMSEKSLDHVPKEYPGHLPLLLMGTFALAGIYGFCYLVALMESTAQRQDRER